MLTTYVQGMYRLCFASVLHSATGTEPYFTRHLLRIRLRHRLRLYRSCCRIHCRMRNLDSEAGPGETKQSAIVVLERRPQT